MFAENAWYVAAWCDEVSEAPLARRILNKPIVLYREVDGSPAALLDACCHRGAPLSVGAVVGRGLRCNYHGMIFNGQGACVHIPGQDIIPKKARVRSFPLVEKNQLVWIWMGEAALADPADILEYAYHDDADRWPHRHGMMHTKSNYLLLIDNLVDVTHLSYVHQATVGGAVPDIHFEAQMSVTPTARGINVRRTMPSEVAPPVYSNCVSFTGKVDRWQDFDFHAPGYCIQYSGAVEQGESREHSVKARFDMRLFHAWTPETEDTTHYFWSAANGHNTDDPNATEMIYQQIFATLLEDKAIVEAEHSRIAELGEDWMVDIRSDAPRVAMRRAIQRLVDQSQASNSSTSQLADTGA